MDPLSAAELLQICRRKGWRLATAESCTGGLLAGALTDIPGSSDVFDRGFVTYSNQAKIDLLGVNEATLLAFGAVSREVADEMARSALLRSNADFAGSVTGIAGPGGSERKPEGLVCFSVAGRNRRSETQAIRFGPLGRARVRTRSVQHALGMLLEFALSADRESP